MRTTKTVPVVEPVVLCDICGAEMGVMCQRGCLGCRRDLCSDHAIWEGLGSNSDACGPWCKRCWDLGEKQRTQYQVAETALDDLYGKLNEEWVEACEDASLED